MSDVSKQRPWGVLLFFFFLMLLLIGALIIHTWNSLPEEPNRTQLSKKPECSLTAQAEKYAALWANQFEDTTKHDFDGNPVKVPAYDVLTCTPRPTLTYAAEFEGNVVCNLRIGSYLHELVCYIEKDTCKQPLKMPCRFERDYGAIFNIRGYR